MHSQRVVAFVQARMGSTRLPGKVLMDLGGKPVLKWVVDAAGQITGVDDVFVLTSTEAGDDPVHRWASEAGLNVFRGDHEDVLARFQGGMDAAGLSDNDIAIRLTGDCPLFDPMVGGMLLRLLKDTGADHASNVDPVSWPDGLDCEIFRVGALRAAAREATRKTDREHVGPFVRRNRTRFKIENLNSPVPNLASERWTVDAPEDLGFVAAVVARLGEDANNHVKVLNLLDREPGLREINKCSHGQVGYVAALARESLKADAGFAKSKATLNRALKHIPLGSQTFSKSVIHYPEGAAPLFATHGQGGRIFDVDGNEYVDLVCGLLPITLGYRDPDVNWALQHQLNRGITFSLATELETELAERLSALIPSAEKVRFGKNGSDVTSAAIRIARAATKRDRVISCGYHGWHDWYIGTTSRNSGVPAAVSELTTSVPYNDLDCLETTLKAHPGKFAAVIMEPMNVAKPKPGYLEAVAELVHKHGTLLIFDEVITGFRFHLGGAQSLFGVIPDLSCFGKGMANGLPISAVVGRAEYMNYMEDIFFSGTFGGETLSLAAANATIDKMQREPVIETLWKRGSELAAGLEKILADRGLANVVQLGGVDPWRILMINPHPAAPVPAIKTRLLIELISRGVLTGGSHNICYAHTEGDVATVLGAYAAAVDVIASQIEDGTLESRLPCDPIKPVFSVRT